MFCSSILLAAALVVAAPPQTNGDNAPKLQQGDAAIVVDNDVAFTQRGRIVGRLPVGTPIKILAVRREKVQVRVTIDGAVRDGWIAASAIRAVPSKDRVKEGERKVTATRFDEAGGTG